MSEQLAFHTLLRPRRTVHATERRLLSGPPPMQLARDQFFPRAALADDQHAARNRRDARNGVAEYPHRLAVADQRRFTVEPRPQRPQFADQAAARDRAFDLLNDPLDRLGLVHEPVGAEPHRLDAAIVASSAGVDDDRRVDAALVQPPKDLEAVGSRHLEIEDDAVDRLAAEQVERLVAATGNRRLVLTDASQVVGVLLGHCRHVIDDENMRAHALREEPVPGMSTTIRVPWPGTLSTLIVPRRSMTSRRTIDSPRPVPPSLVV